MSLIPEWARDYRRAWLRPDVIAALVIWSVVVPQACAYAQIAGLPPAAGLAAAPVAMFAYGLIGLSRTLVVSATTATSAVSAATIGPLAHGDMKDFAALSAMFAVIVGVVLMASGLIKVGGVADLVSKPVLTGFLFGLGLTITIGQAPNLFGVPGGSGNFFRKAWSLLTHLGDTQGWTLVVGASSVVALIALKRLAPQVPGTLVVLAGAIFISAVFKLSQHGVDVVGALPAAYPKPALPSASFHQMVDMLGPAFGILLLTTEAVGVSRAIATADGYQIQPNRELVAIGSSNLLTGFSSGFVQSGGASQTMAAEEAGGKSQLGTLIAAGLILLTGLFLAPLFKNLPEATLSAIVIVAISSFFRVDELRRFARIRRSAIVFALVALFGVLIVGVLPGLLIAAGLSLAAVIQRLSRPEVSVLARDPSSGVWGNRINHPDWVTHPGTLVARVEGPLFHANSVSVKDQLLAFAAQESPKRLVLGLAQTGDLDVESLDMLAELQARLAQDGIELEFAEARARTIEMLTRGGVAEHAHIAPTLDLAVEYDAST